MNRKLAFALVALAVALAAFFFFFKPSGPRGPVKVTLRLSVSPGTKTDFVLAQATSARFKYEMGKQAGVRPALAQQLAVRGVPNTALVEARLGVESPEAARLYADAFIETLQRQCGTEAELALVERTIR